jgi:hypothetical protein
LPNTQLKISSKTRIKESFRRRNSGALLWLGWMGLSLLLLGPSRLMFAQGATTVSAKDPTHADSAEVAAINQLVSDFYQAISAPAGGKLDRQKLESLFAPGGRIATARPPRGASAATVVLRTPEEYATGSDGFTAKSGFFDRVLHNRVETFGLMAHVYSAYASRTDPKDERPLARGIKSFELLHSGGKWLIVQVYWDSERPDNPIPPEYLDSH